MILTNVLREARQALHDAGLRGSILVRDLDSGDELGVDPDIEFPVASLVKLPLAVATLERVIRGELDLATPIVVAPGQVTTAGPTGLSKFRYPATVALADLLYLSTSISDGTAADALFAITAPAAVSTHLRGLGFDGINVRHRITELMRTPAERFEFADAHLAHSLAINATTPGHGHPIAQLDISQANTGSARAFVDLLRGLWRPSTIHPTVAAHVRQLMGDNVLRHRLAPEFSTDASRWSSKTGTLLNLRHEVGVVEHANGQAYAVAALTESRVSAAAQTEAEAVMAHVTRTLHDHLRTYA